MDPIPKNEASPLVQRIQNLWNSSESYQPAEGWTYDTNEMSFGYLTGPWREEVSIQTSDEEGQIPETRLVIDLINDYGYYTQITYTVSEVLDDQRNDGYETSLEFHSAFIRVVDQSGMGEEQERYAGLVNNKGATFVDGFRVSLPEKMSETGIKWRISEGPIVRLTQEQPNFEQE